MLVYVRPLIELEIGAGGMLRRGKRKSNETIGPRLTT
jgi:hypothetical protein